MVASFTSFPLQRRSGLHQHPQNAASALPAGQRAGHLPLLAKSRRQRRRAPASAALFKNLTNGTPFIEGAETSGLDPNVTGVGGTNLVTVPTPTANDVTYSQENAQFDPLLPAEFLVGPNEIVPRSQHHLGSESSYSVLFPVAAQLFSATTKPGRAVPDISLMMGGCPQGADTDAGACSEPTSADIIWIGGGIGLLIGTSSSSPEMAGVLALDVELNGRLGNVNPLIYNMSFAQTLTGPLTPPSLQVFHRDIKGNNNGFKVRPGDAYSPVLGNSTINVKNSPTATAAPAGIPGTPSNP